MLNALAVIGDRHSNQLSEIKTTAEYGYPYLAIPAFFGMFVPKAHLGPLSTRSTRQLRRH
jgi:tripartite-type tricarboxylate transporter receptor subunit TctC